MRIIRKKFKKPKKKKKMYPAQRGAFKIKRHTGQWTRRQDVDQAVYYPNRTQKFNPA